MEIRFIPAAIADLATLNPSTIRRLVKRIAWLANNFNSISPERLIGEFSQLYKFRVGDYRILYQVLENEDALLIHQIGHRRDVYRH